MEHRAGFVETDFVTADSSSDTLGHEQDAGLIAAEGLPDEAVHRSSFLGWPLISTGRLGWLWGMLGAYGGTRSANPHDEVSKSGAGARERNAK
jgi:hypothetical protein